jgi:hypothetical protein
MPLACGLPLEVVDQVIREIRGDVGQGQRLYVMLDPENVGRSSSNTVLPPEERICLPPENPPLLKLEETHPDPAAWRGVAQGAQHLALRIAALPAVHVRHASGATARISRSSTLHWDQSAVAGPTACVKHAVHSSFVRVVSPTSIKATLPCA